MFKKSILSFCLLLIGGVATAQKNLEVKDISHPNDVFSSANNEAAVIIRCHESIPLSFTSSMDKSVEPFRRELQGADSVYYISFPTGNRYRGRELTILARGYRPVLLVLELQPKQLLSFHITDPNALVDTGCYREHRNKGVLEIKNSNYEEARNLFIVARECSDCDIKENEENIAIVDSLIIFRRKGDEAFKLLDYFTAGNYYMKVLNLNSYDNYASNRNTLCTQKYTEECSVIYSKAEYYYSEKEYDKAKELYEKVIEKECLNMPLAIERINYINSYQKAKKDHARVFTYEYRKDVPLGFSYGKYNMHKTGGFINLDLNTKLIDATRSDGQYGDNKFPEANIAFGWTFKIANPVWIHLGPGATMKMYYGSYLDKKYPKIGFGENDILDTKKMGDDLQIPKEEIPDSYEKAWKKKNFAFAVSPVIGFTVKYSYFAIRFTYQYRWPIIKDLTDFVGTQRISVGAGFAF